MIAGVAGLIAARLGLDPLWVRLAFVVLALVGGLGLLVYLGLWLVLIVGARPDRSAMRYLGAGVLLVLVPLFISDGNLGLLWGPLGMLGLLVGLTVALWQPRGERSGASPAAPAPGPGLREPHLTVAAPPPPAPAPRPPSLLGRATLGAAVIVAAAGALIDQANGGRLHPEQWLGAAAAVCGLGLVVGAFRGHARWLVLPAALFAGSGFVAGVAAKAGVDAGHLTGERSILLAAGSGAGPFVEEVAFGSVRVTVVEEPSATSRVVAQVGIGDVGIDAPPDVTVEVRADLGHGEVRVNGVPRPDGDDVVVVGPDGPPDVVVEAHIERGSINVLQTNTPLIDRADRPGVPVLDGPELDAPVGPVGGLGELEPIADGVAATTDGWLVLADGEVLIDPDDQVIGDTSFTEGAAEVIPTSIGDFRLLPRRLLLTPSGEVIDLDQVRARLAEPTATSSTTATTGG